MQAPAKDFGSGGASYDTDSEEVEVLWATGKIYVQREGQFAIKRHSVLDNPELEWAYGSPQDAIEEIEEEKRIYRYLGSYEGIVKLCDDDPNEHALRTFYVSPGDLRKYLESNKIDQSTQLRWCTTMARTLNYVHKKRVLVMDVRTPNWVVAEDGSVKLLDFGVSEIWPEDTPPEEVDIGQFTIGLELGMLGSVFYEVITRSPPGFHILDSKDTIDGQLRIRIPPIEETPSLESVFLGDIIKKLWTAQFKSAEELLQALEQVEVAETA